MLIVNLSPTPKLESYFCFRAGIIMVTFAVVEDTVSWAGSLLFSSEDFKSHKVSLCFLLSPVPAVWSFMVEGGSCIFHSGRQKGKCVVLGLRKKKVTPQPPPISDK